MLLDFIDRQREAARQSELGPGGFTSRDGLEVTLLTPRFRASRHVVFMLVRKSDAQPVFVAKVARLPGDTEMSDREAANLRAAQAALEGGFDSIPRVIACQVFRGHAVLLETALVGADIDPAAIRAAGDRRIRAIGD